MITVTNMTTESFTLYLINFANMVGIYWVVVMDEDGVLYIYLFIILAGLITQNEAFEANQTLVSERHVRANIFPR